MAYDFTKDLMKKPEELTRAPVLPMGTYVCYISDLFTVNKERKNAQGLPYTIYEFPVRVLEPKDVNHEALRAFGDLSKAPVMRRSFWYEEGEDIKNQNVSHAIGQFINEHLRAEGANLLEKMNNSKGCRFVAEIGWRPDRNEPEIHYAEIKRTAPL